MDAVQSRISHIPRIVMNYSYDGSETFSCGNYRTITVKKMFIQFKLNVTKACFINVTKWYLITLLKTQYNDMKFNNLCMKFNSNCCSNVILCTNFVWPCSDNIFFSEHIVLIFLHFNIQYPPYLLPLIKVLVNFLFTRQTRNQNLEVNNKTLPFSHAN